MNIQRRPSSWHADAETVDTAPRTVSDLRTWLQVESHSRRCSHQLDAATLLGSTVSVCLVNVRETASDLARRRLFTMADAASTN